MHLSTIFRTAAACALVVLGAGCAQQQASSRLKSGDKPVPAPRIVAQVTTPTPTGKPKPGPLVVDINAPTPTETPSPSVTPTPTPTSSAATKTASAPTPSPSPVAEKSPASNSPAVPTQGVTVRWYGHAFIYLTSAAGVRVAIDPFAEGRIKYPFPQRLPADVVLITNESEEHAGGDRLFGNPPVFRSITAIGMNKGNGFLFRGVQTYRTADHGPAGSSNTCFTFDMDGIRFAHLGALGHTLNSKEKREIGRTDVVFLPVGIKEVTAKEWLKIAEDTQAKVIVPMVYDSPKSGVDLRPLDEFLNGLTNVKKIDASEFNISYSTLPARPTVYALTPP